MTVRYLYADSEPFPHEYDFLATLREFLVCSAACLEGTVEIDGLRDRLSRSHESLERTNRAIEAFSDTLSDQVELARARAASTSAVNSVADSVLAFISRTAEDTRRSEMSTSEAMSTELSGAVAAQDERMRQHVQAFFLSAQLDVLASRLKLQLEGERYASVGVCVFPEGAEVSYRLASARLEAWQKPRKISDLVGSFEIQIGMKKKFLKKDMTREFARLDDYIISATEIDDVGATVTLRKKADGPDQMVLRIRDIDGILSTEIQRLDDGVLGSSIPAATADTQKLEQLWSVLNEATREILLHREKVVAVALDGAALEGSEATLDFVRRYVAYLAPTVSEIVKRSPSKKELSLKLEHDDGRREELYLRKDELFELIGDLDASAIQYFAPLDFLPELELEAD